MTSTAAVDNTAIEDCAQGWDAIYARGEDANEEPWTNVVSFVNRFVVPRGGDRISFLELGCGSGPNLRFAARLGFDCIGIDVSAVALELCQKRLDRDGLSADIRLCPYGKLPFADGSFDCVIDRASLMFADDATLTQTVSEVHRVLKPSGLFFHNTVADVAAANLVALPRSDAEAGTTDTATYEKYPDFRLSSAQDLYDRFGPQWNVRELKRIDRTTFAPALDIAAEWELVAEKA